MEIKNQIKIILILIFILLIFSTIYIFYFTQSLKYRFIIYGIEFRNNDKKKMEESHKKMIKKLNKYQDVVILYKIDSEKPFIRYKMNEKFLKKYAPQFDTLRLNQKLGLDPVKDLEQEIIYSMLLSSEPFMYPTYEEFESALNIRINIVKNSEKSFLNFDCSEIDRPKEYWVFNEEKGGWLLKKDKSLLEALRKTITPPNDSKGYAFSCYRATEYVLLLSLVEELDKVNNNLYEKIENCFMNRVIKSKEFHETFLRDHGYDHKPLPILYFVPGDRVYFKNPDSKSSDVLGYEGSWMIYLGNNKFKNFWQTDNNFSLEDKLVEAYTYSLCTYEDENGKLQIDDPLTYVKLEEIKKNKKRYNKLVSRYMRYRDLGKEYKNGGGIDRYSEIFKYVHPETSDIIINY